MRRVVSAGRRATRRVDPRVQLYRPLLLEGRQYQSEQHGQAHEDRRQDDLEWFTLQLSFSFPLRYGSS